MKRPRSGVRGYTLIEMVVVTTIVALLAALIVPNLVALQRSRALRETQVALLRLPSIARNRAQESRTPVLLRVDGDALVIETDTETAELLTTDGTVDNRPTSTRTDNDTSSSDFRQRVPFGNSIAVETARQNGDSLDPETFRWVVFPDGSAEDSELTFQVGPDRKTLLLPSEGSPRWIEGDLPEETEERWPAGEVETRVSS
ncbi:MAG: prepilin-type N-terminal cleavage/methylation domain-containing protein [Capsulimonadales bacterium]|nr:prepilin-type N-terminal cleavage/methylation domain-containing protein [Capsulimonadales bacterium]